MSNRQGESSESFRVDVEQSHPISEMTIAHYDRMAEAYWDGTREHDVSQNYTALLDAIEGDPPYSILDLGCGPGRDLRYFRSLGHDVVGLDGSTEFVAMARSYSECEVLQQDFLAMALPESRFDGVDQPAEVGGLTSLDGQVLDENPWERVGSRGFDDSDVFAAYLHTRHWNSVTATDERRKVVDFWLR